MDEKPDRNEIIPFTPHDHDVRIVRPGWVFYVRGVKAGEPFRGDIAWDGTLMGALLVPVLKGIGYLARRRVRTWKVGVLTFRDRKLGGRVRVVFKEKLPPGEEPARRIEELVSEVNRGRFDQ